MTWRPAGNIEKIAAIVEADFPGLVEYEIGNAAHAAEQSDHNPDSRGVVHAVDLMFQNDTNFGGGAPKTLAWLLTPGVRNSLQYVIHDAGIWSVSWGWTRHAYTGSDPHTNHIHVSGLHATPGVGKNDATGTGYSLAAESMTPVGTPLGDEVTPADIAAIAKAVTDSPAFADLAWRVEAIANMRDTFGGGSTSVKGKPVAITAQLKATASGVSVANTGIAKINATPTTGLTFGSVVTLNEPPVVTS